jgi:hypothetical protein
MSLFSIELANEAGDEHGAFITSDETIFFIFIIDSDL